MANKKISELDSRASLSLSDLLAVGDPTTGYLYKITITDLKTLTGAGVISFNGRVGSVTPAEGDYTLNQLGDVIITTATNNDVLRYNGSNWVNAQLFTGTIAQYVDGTGAYQTFPTLLSSDRLITEVRNTTGATVTKGTVIYLSGSSGTLPLIAKAQANSEATSSSTYGVVQNDIANNANGYVVVIGNLTGINTSAYNAGDILWLSPTVAGGVTTTKPSAPNNSVYIGIVTRSNTTTGSIEVKVQNGYELDELHNVAISSVANNEVLVYESASSLWKNKTIPTILGYTPANAATYVPYTGATADLNTGAYNIYTNSLVVTNGGSGFLAALTADTLNGIGILNLTNAGKNGYLKPTTLGADRTWTLPNASGTIALTTDIPSLVGLVTLGTLQTINGTKLFSVQQYFDNLLSLKEGTSGSATGYTTLGANTNQLIIGVQGASHSMTFPTSANYTYTFPGATGTIALTTDLSSYVPTSRTLTINGTTYDLSANRSWTVSGSQWTTSGSDIYYNTGTVGIGTTTPTGLGTGYGTLDVRGSTGGGINMGNSTNSGYIYFDGALRLQTSASAITFLPSGTERMRLDTSGNLGIGTTSPTFKLDVTGTGRFTGNLTLTGSYVDLQNTTYIRFSNSGGGTRWGYIQHNGTDIGFNNDISGGKFTFTGGNVGIGTSTPTDSSGFGQIVDLNGPSGSAYYARYNSSATAYILMGQDASASYFYAKSTPMTFLVNNAERMRITSGGNVGIGSVGSSIVRLVAQGSSTSNAAYAFIAADSAGATLLAMRNDGLFDTGTRAASPYNNTYGNAANVYIGSDGVMGRSTSSIKYKTDVKDYDKGLAEVLKMRPVYYKSKHQKETGVQFAGLIAEEIHNLGLTEFVQYADDKTPDALAYQNMVSLLVKAIQEQQIQIEQLKNK